MIEAVEHVGFSVAMSNFGIGYPFFWMNLIIINLAETSNDGNCNGIRARATLLQMLGGRPSWSTGKVVIQVSEKLDFRQITRLLLAALARQQIKIYRFCWQRVWEPSTDL